MKTTFIYYLHQFVLSAASVAQYYFKTVGDLGLILVFSGWRWTIRQNFHLQGGHLL